MRNLCVCLPFKKELLKKFDLFEEFLTKNLKLSAKEYSTLEELSDASLAYDYYISGSDQIWNTACYDFDWSYYLAFVKNGTRIAYAPSMGPKASKAIKPAEIEVAKQHLAKYDHVAVREEGTAEMICTITGKKPEIVLDPTLLLTHEQWLAAFDNRPIIQGDYIFFYSPFYRPQAIELARKLSKKLGMKVVISLAHSSTFLIKHMDFEKKLDVGPWEFLNLCKNAKLICGSSFHVSVFAILLKTPFYAVDGMNDNRVRNLLQITDLTERSLTLEEFDAKVGSALDIDFDAAHQKLALERAKSLDYLDRSLASNG